MRRVGTVLAIVVALAAAPRAAGQTQEPPPDPDAQPEQTDASLDLDPSWSWMVRIRPILWVPGLSGDLELPLSSSIDVQTINADETRLTPAGQLDLQIDKVSVQFRAYGFSLNERASARSGFNLGGTPIAPGTTVDTDITFSSFDLTGGYRVWTPVEDLDREVRLSFDLYGGIRVHALDVTVRSLGALSGGEETWVHPIVGARLILDLPHRFAIAASFDAGWLPLGNDSAASWDATASFLWLIHPNVGAEIGFRHQSVSLSNGTGTDEFGFNGWIAGLYGALTIRF